MQCLRIGSTRSTGLSVLGVRLQLMYDGRRGRLLRPPSRPSRSRRQTRKWPATATPRPPTGFSQMVFCATTASIVSGTIAERTKMWPFFIFVAVLTGVIYPITGSWQWGAGWLLRDGLLRLRRLDAGALGRQAGAAARRARLIIGAVAADKVTTDRRQGECRCRASSIGARERSARSSSGLGLFSASTAPPSSALGTITRRPRPVAQNSSLNTNPQPRRAGVGAAMILCQIVLQRRSISPSRSTARLAGLVSITAGPLGPSVSARRS